MVILNKYRPTFWEKTAGILGINARNLLYISRYNTKANKSFADDKIFTKNYLQSRGLGTAKVFFVIKNYKELNNFNPKSLPESFVIKPNRGYGGEGIIVFVEKKGDKFVDIEGEEHDWKSIYRHASAILDGKYAISGLSDQIIVEERLLANDFFKLYAEKGLPDIRIIVFNYVPVIAMLRLPTQESKGKANLHMGAVGVGIDIATGEAMFAVHHNKFVSRLPNGEDFHQIKIPNWKEILLIASNAQRISQIGFLAADIVLTTNGIKILELNARAGLSVQIANQIPLKARLKKVADLKVPNPEKGVEICQALFSANASAPSKEKTDPLRPIIGLFEYVDFLKNDLDRVVAKIEPHFDRVLIDNRFKSLLPQDSFVDVRLKGRRITLPAKFGDLSKEPYKVIIGGKFLQGFLVDITLNKQLPFLKDFAVGGGERGEKVLLNVDKKIYEIEKRINIIGSLRPVNLDQAKEEFLRHPVKSPRFFYNNPEIDLGQIKREIKALPKELDHPLAELYLKKMAEMENKVSLLEAIDSVGLQRKSEKLYGLANRILYDQANRYINEHTVQPDESEEMDFKQVVKKLESFLLENKLSGWKVKVVTDRVSDISVGRNNFIILRDGAKFTQNRFHAIVAHEIATHIFRLENGRLQKYKIFEIGTATYLPTEEGLAVYNQQKLGLPLGEKEIWPALRAIGCYLAQEMSFVDLFHHLKDNYRLDDESAWRACVKAKRGLADTDKKISFTRDIIYFKGFLKVKTYLEDHEQTGLKNLYLGKVGIGDLKYLGNLNDYRVRYLPDWEKIKNF